jgi:heat shock protein HslJ
MQELSRNGWRVTEIGAEPVIAETTVTVEFGDDGAVSGSAGCNRYRAEYHATGQTLSIGTAAVTRMFCSTPHGVMDQENAFLHALAGSTGLAEAGDGLVLLDADGAQALRLAPM